MSAQFLEGASQDDGRPPAGRRMPIAQGPQRKGGLQEERQQANDDERGLCGRRDSRERPGAEQREQAFTHRQHDEETEDAREHAERQLQRRELQDEEPVGLEPADRHDRVDQARDAIEQQRGRAGKQRRRHPLGLHDLPVPQRQDAEDAGIARIERQPIPLDDGDQRHDDHRRAEDQQPIGEPSQCGMTRCGKRRHHVLG